MVKVLLSITITAYLILELPPMSRLGDIQYWNKTIFISWSNYAVLDEEWVSGINVSNLNAQCCVLSFLNQKLSTVAFQIHIIWFYKWYIINSDTLQLIRIITNDEFPFGVYFKVHFGEVLKCVWFFYHFCADICNIWRRYNLTFLQILWYVNKFVILENLLFNYLFLITCFFLAVASNQLTQFPIGSGRILLEAVDSKRALISRTVRYDTGL